MKRCIAAISAGFVLALAAGVATANAGLPMPEQVAAPSFNETNGGNVAVRLDRHRAGRWSLR